MALTFDEEKARLSNIRLQKILDYAARREKRTDSEKENDCQDIDEFQQEWVDAKMQASKRSWERWDGVIKEWTPWNRFGDPINMWRHYYKK